MVSKKRNPRNNIVIAVHANVVQDAARTTIKATVHKAKETTKAETNLMQNRRVVVIQKIPKNGHAVEDGDAIAAHSKTTRILKLRPNRKVSPKPLNLELVSTLWKSCESRVVTLSAETSP